MIIGHPDRAVQGRKWIHLLGKFSGERYHNDILPGPCGSAGQCISRKGGDGTVLVSVDLIIPVAVKLQYEKETERDTAGKPRI